MYSVLAQRPFDGVAASDRTTLLFEPGLAIEGSNDAPRLVTLDSTAFVPLVFDRVPTRQEDADGAGRILITLAPEHVQHLRVFTRRHLNSVAALVVDDGIVSVHKIRAVIEDGRMQITSCSERSCKRIFSRIASRADAG
jgi:hypothetical protein